MKQFMAIRFFFVVYDFFGLIFFIVFFNKVEKAEQKKLKELVNFIFKAVSKREITFLDYIETGIYLTFPYLELSIACEVKRDE
jgi:hypothetical protein